MNNKLEELSNEITQLSSIVSALESRLADVKAYSLGSIDDDIIDREEVECIEYDIDHINRQIIRVTKEYVHLSALVNLAPHRIKVK